VTISIQKYLRMRGLAVLLFVFIFHIPNGWAQSDTESFAEEQQETREQGSEIEVDETATESISESPPEPSIEWEEAPLEEEQPLGGPVIESEKQAAAGRGPRYILEKIEIMGNGKTLRQVILRDFDIKPGEVFSADDPRLEKSRYRLLSSGFFYDVQLSLKKGSRRGWAILIVTVKERNTIVLQDLVLGFSEISDFYSSVDLAERSFLGTGVELSGAVVFSLDEQWGYRLRLQDDHFLNSPFGLHVEGLFTRARDFFGRKNICVEMANEAEGYRDPCAGADSSGSAYQKSVPYAVLKYRRGGIRLGTGYTLLKDNYFWIDYRGEVIAADVPKAGYHKSFGEYRPIEFGHMLWGHSFLSSIVFGLTRDTRDSITLTSEGARTALQVELATEILGSDYEFSKFTLAHDMFFRVHRSHSLKLGFFGGLIMGSAPFFNQFFVGDFSSFVPSRVLELNFSHLQPNLLRKTIIKEMRYEDIAASINLEYSLSFYRGNGMIYGINGFVAFGAFFLASKEHLKYDPKGYAGCQLVPIDLTADIGIKIDTRVGLFVISLANLLRLVPEQGAAEK
jgi:outer membrane protein insertion porin family